MEPCVDALQIALAVAGGIALFLFGIEHFSKEVQSISGPRFRRFLARATGNRFAGFLLGGLTTAVIQSSTATSVIAVGLVNAGVLSFRNALGVLFGANVGTTVTAQLVALKLTDFAPGLILLGFVAGYLPFRWRVFNRAIFYFGMVFFSLNLVGVAVAPLRDSPTVLGYFGLIDDPVMGVLAGAVFTALVQSSSVTTGIAIVLLDQGIISFELALPLMLGANVGTTITAFIASASFDTSARRTAVSHAVYNIGGVVIFLPFLGIFSRFLAQINASPAATLALAHFAFNAGSAMIFLAALRPFAATIERLIPDASPQDPLPPTPRTDSDSPADIVQLRTWLTLVLGRYAAAYTAVGLAIQTRDKAIRNRAQRLMSMIQYALEESQDAVYGYSRQQLSAEQSKDILRMVVTVDHMRQLLDSLEDLAEIETGLARRGGRFSMDALLDIQRICPLAATMLRRLAEFYSGADTLGRVREEEHQLGETLEDCYRRLIEFVRSDHEGSELPAFLSVHQRLRSKALAFASHLEAATSPVVSGG